MNLMTSDRWACRLFSWGLIGCSWFEIYPPKFDHQGAIILALIFMCTGIILDALKATRAP